MSGIGVAIDCDGLVIDVDGPALAGVGVAT
jgi:hypothetical protein